MSADLHLIALPNSRVFLEAYCYVQRADWFTESDEGYDRDKQGYLHWRGVSPILNDDLGLTFAEADSVRDRVYECPNVWVGQVSWLKAALDEDVESWVPAPVAEVVRLLGDEPRRLTPSLAKSLLIALNRADNSHFSRTHWHWRDGRFYRSRSRGMAKRQHVKRWLNANLNAMVVAESW